MIAISVPIGDRGTVFLIDLLVGKVFGGSSVPGQDHCLGSIAPGQELVINLPTSMKKFSNEEVTLNMPSSIKKILQ